MLWSYARTLPVTFGLGRRLRLPIPPKKPINPGNSPVVPLDMGQNLDFRRFLVSSRQLDDFRVLRFRLPARLSVPLHLHSTDGFALLLGGSYRAQLREQRLLARSGSLLTVPAHLEHREWVGKSGGDSVIVAALGTRRPRAAAVPHLFEHPHLARLAAVLDRELIPTERLTDSDLNEIIEEILDLIDRAEPRTARPSPRQPSWLREAGRRLDSSNQALPIGVLATELGLHRSHLSRRFRQFYGCSPTEYGRLRRLDGARVALTSENEPMAKIARRFGFCDAAHLSRLFRRYYGEPPSRHFARRD